jgi:uncharacterized protein YutE (UPF0331/DUF86 family)
VVDAARLRAVLSRLTARRGPLAAYAALDVAAYLADPQAVPASRYHLLTAIEDALAVANHVIAAEGYRAPTDYADAFRSLAEARVLAPDLAERLEQMAGFRNLLVHEYAKVDDRRVHAFLRRDMEDLDRFVGAVLAAFPELGRSDT